MHRLKQHSAGSLWLAHTRQTGKHRRRCLRRRHPAAAAIAARYNFTHFRTMTVTITVEIREERGGGCRFIRVFFRVNRNISGKRGGQVWPGRQGHQNGATESLRRTPNSHGSLNGYSAALQNPPPVCMQDNAKQGVTHIKEFHLRPVLRTKCGCTSSCNSRVPPQNRQ